MYIFNYYSQVHKVLNLPRRNLIHRFTRLHQRQLPLISLPQIVILPEDILTI